MRINVKLKDSGQNQKKTSYKSSEYKEKSKID